MGAFALPIFAGASILSSILGGVLGGKAASEQAAGAIDASTAANQTEFDQQQLTRSDLGPYTNLGSGAAATLANLEGIAPPAGAGGPTSDQSKQLSTLQTSLKWYQDVLAGRGAPGWNGGAPSNAATRAKLQGEMQSVQQQITSLQEQLQNQQNQAAAAAGQDKSQFGSLLKPFDTADFQTDPGYQFRLSEGQKALERSEAARGGVQSGGTLKDLTQYNQDFASNEYQNAYNRFNTNKLNTFNILSGTAGLGQRSASQVADLGKNTATQIADNTANGITGAGNATAAGYTNEANSINSGIQSLINLYANRNNIQNGTGSNGGGGNWTGILGGQRIPTSVPSLRRPAIIVN